MANPNIVNISSLIGKTAIYSVTTTIQSLLSNALASNKVLKVNSLIVSNVHTDNHQITVDLFRSSVSTKIANNIVVPAGSSLVVISKEISIYLEEGDSIRVQGSGDTFSNGRLQIVCSYEDIS